VARHPALEQEWLNLHAENDTLDRLPVATRQRSIAALLIASGFLIGACNKAPQPTVIPKLLIDNFPGTLAPSGVVTFPFTTGAEGHVTLTITSLDPLSTITVGVGIGYPNSGGCSIFELNNTVAVSSPVTDSDLPASSYCVAVYDAGAVTQTVTFTLKVEHY
jgi:hypothetical protein